MRCQNGRGEPSRAMRAFGLLVVGFAALVVVAIAVAVLNGILLGIPYLVYLVFGNAGALIAFVGLLLGGAYLLCYAMARDLYGSGRGSD